MFIFFLFFIFFLCHSRINLHVQIASVRTSQTREGDHFKINVYSGIVAPRLVCLLLIHTLPNPTQRGIEK